MSSPKQWDGAMHNGLQLGMLFHPTAAFKAYVAAQNVFLRNIQAAEATLSLHGDPCSCPTCHSTELRENIKDTLDGHTVMEYEVVCKQCMSNVAYWAHGSYEPLPAPEDNPSYF